MSAPHETLKLIVDALAFAAEKHRDVTNCADRRIACTRSVASFGGKAVGFTWAENSPRGISIPQRCPQWNRSRQRDAEKAPPPDWVEQKQARGADRLTRRST